MFERELTDSLFIQRWSIVRTLMPQSVAEHTFLVSHYANDIATLLNVNPMTHLVILQYALWHDAKDEIFTADLPGPNKRGLLDAIGPEAKKAWDAKLDEWASRTFKNLDNRSGSGQFWDSKVKETVKLIVKTADWLEAAVRMATEAQMGNRCANRHVTPNTKGALETAAKLCEFYYEQELTGDVPLEPNQADAAYKELSDRIVMCVEKAISHQSLGPWITKEDENRTYHDPTVDSTEEQE